MEFFRGWLGLCRGRNEIQLLRRCGMQVFGKYEYVRLNMLQFIYHSCCSYSFRFPTFTAIDDGGFF